MEIMRADIRSELLARRQKLEKFSTTHHEASHLAHLPDEVEDALKRIDSGSYGPCEICHDPIEKDRLAADPLLRYCLDHLTRRQRDALQQDLELASRVQMALLSQRSPSFHGWDVAYSHLPLGPVSGDYCNLVMQGEHPRDLHFLLGDVAGKGLF